MGREDEKGKTKKKEKKKFKVWYERGESRWGGGESMGWLWIREHNDRGAHSLSGITTLPPLVCLSDEN